MEYLLLYMALDQEEDDKFLKPYNGIKHMELHNTELDFLKLILSHIKIYKNEYKNDSKIETKFNHLMESVPLEKIEKMIKVLEFMKKTQNRKRYFDEREVDFLKDFKYKPPRLDYIT